MSILDRFRKGEFVVSIQLDPPGVGGSVENFKKTVDALVASGVRVFDINSSRRTSDDSIYLAGAIIKPRLEIIPHVTTRDSSVDGLINQISAAYRWDDVNNFLVITGDPRERKHSKSPSKKLRRGVYQTDSVGALGVLDKHLKKEKGLIFALAAAVNQNEPDLEREGKRILAKIASGADFFMSQTVFTREQAFRLTEFYGKYTRLPLVVGVWPLVSLETAKNLRKGGVEGVVLPKQMYLEAKRIGLKNKANLKRWGLARAQKLIEYVRFCTNASGVYIVAPSRNPQLLLDLLPKIL